MLQLTHVTLKTRQVILQDVDFTFEKGRIYGILAINGSGKTTLFRAISNLIPISSGNIAVSPSLFYYESIEWLDENLSGMDYLRLIKNIWKSGLNLRDEIAYWEMSDYISLPIRKYSLGMKQRLVIAMYFLSQAKCWLMDEITNGLDEYYRQKFSRQRHSPPTYIPEGHTLPFPQATSQRNPLPQPLQLSAPPYQTARAAQIHRQTTTPATPLSSA